MPIITRLRSHDIQRFTLQPEFSDFLNFRRYHTGKGRKITFKEITEHTKLSKEQVQEMAHNMGLPIHETYFIFQGKDLDLTHSKIFNNELKYACFDGSLECVKELVRMGLNDKQIIESFEEVLSQNQKQHWKTLNFLIDTYHEKFFEQHAEKQTGEQYLKVRQQLITGCVNFKELTPVVKLLGYTSGSKEQALLIEEIIIVSSLRSDISQKVFFPKKIMDKGYSIKESLNQLRDNIHEDMYDILTQYEAVLFVQRLERDMPHKQNTSVRLKI